MEALLAGATRKDTSGVGSVAELANKLHNLLAQNVTPTKAEHISTAFELRSNVVFHIPVTDPNAATNVDPLLGGSPAPEVHDGQTIRTINASDTLMNQPQDDPVLQKSVASYLITTVGGVDGSNWITRSVSRAAQGWSFTYICKHSCQAWSRQAAKNPAKVVIGAWSNKDGQDPVNLGQLFSPVYLPRYSY